MTKPTPTQRLSYWRIYAPLRLYFLLFIAFGLLGWWWLGYHTPSTPGAVSTILLLLLKVTFTFVGSLLVLSFLSVAVPFSMAWWQKKRGTLLATLQNESSAPNAAHHQTLQIEVKPLVQPMFGFLQYRVVYDGTNRSPKFTLLKKGAPLTLFQTVQKGSYNWPLPAIRQYEVEHLVIYFEDLFQFFSLTCKLPLRQSFYTKPSAGAVSEQSVVPQKTETEQVRIEELRRVEGEMLHYKNFENNDDVRRIVWKIYAKNKDLVVRTPENLDPFASHLYFYCSFFDSLGIKGHPALETTGLNGFKNACWTVYEQLKKQGAEIKFLADQPLPTRYLTDAAQQAEYQLAVSQWHQNQALTSYVNAKIASVVCVHGLADPKALEMLLNDAATGLHVVLVRLEKTVATPGFFSWLRWIFLQEEKEKEKTNGVRWLLSPMRRKMLANEKKLEALIKQSEATLIVI
ncbi:MAG: DUF58 domain-containing protein [Bacteroidetes bacterium]|nr:MAG: DUF58 domain-containing protein [Bacteroidota bacterium]